MNWNDFTKIDLESLVPPNVFQKGFSYYMEGHLLKTCKVEEVLAGEVIGTGGKYKARLWFESSELHWECSCPYPDFCKHLVALGMAWIEKKTEFINLEPKLSQVLQTPSELPGIVRLLVEKDPLIFLELFLTPQADSGFLTNRGIINLIRNTFQQPYLTTDNIGALWDRLKQIERLILQNLQKGDLEAIALLQELLTALIATYKNYSSEVLRDYFQTLPPIIGELPTRIESINLRALLITLFENYLDQSLWEFSAGLREIITCLGAHDQDYLREQVAGKIAESPDRMILIGLYELLRDPFLREMAGDFLEKTEQMLRSSAEGLLWLIDRLMEVDPEQAYQLARSGIRSGEFPVKRAFRDRLITLHLLRNEPKQAASLSFIQFQEEPNFEEYLRLKNILSAFPSDWAGYRKRIQAFLTEREEQILLIRIAVDQEDFEEVRANLNQILNNDALLLTAVDLFCQVPPAALSGVYPLLINTLLANPGPRNRNAAFRLMIAYKKLCSQFRQKEEWEAFRQKLLTENEENPMFKRKFGTILGE